MTNHIREIIVIASSIVGLLATAIPLVIKLVRKSKQWIKERDWNKIASILPSFIVEAEKFNNYTGIEKKEFVKSRLVLFAIKNKIAFDETKFDTAIDNIVKLTKEVNQRSKDRIIL